MYWYKEGVQNVLLLTETQFMNHMSGGSYSACIHVGRRQNQLLDG